MDKGENVGKEDRKLCKLKKSLLKEKLVLRASPISEVNVTDQVQKLISKVRIL
jgi:hypothetical protein